jgi:parallel beta-helix repeat protein
VLNDFINISNFKIMHCGIDSGPGDDSGIFIQSNSTKIEECIFQENECAIMMDFITCKNKVINCSLINNYLGIWVHGSNNVVNNNLIKDTGNMGIMLDYTDNCTVEKNEFINNAIGSRLINSNNNLLLNNSYLNNWYTAIQIHHPSTYQNNIINNLFEENEIGIDIFSDAYNNYIYHNNFINNNINARDTGSNTWDNGYPSGGNYWDDYTGRDIYKGPGQDIYGSDNIGDTPHPITGNSNQDNYPFMYPYGEEPPFDQPPSVHLIYPTDGETLKDTITIKWNAHDSEDGTNIPIHFYIYDENDIFTIFKDNPYDNTGELQWDTTQYPDGEYRLLIETQDSHLNIGLDDALITVKNHEDPIENLPPNKPFKPSGELSGKTGDEYNYQTSTSDPDGDQIWYKWDWGDETSGWLGPYDGGVTITTPHTWDEDGEYIIKVKAKDVYGDESDLSDSLIVTMPKTKMFNQIPKILVWLFERFPFIQTYFPNYF